MRIIKSYGWWYLEEQDASGRWSTVEFAKCRDRFRHRINRFPGANKLTI